MKHERLTEALYDWLVASAPVKDVPMGSRLLRWHEVTQQDRELAEVWRDAVDAFLEGIGTLQARDAELAFDAYRRTAPVLAGDDDPGDEHKVTPDGG